MYKTYLEHHGILGMKWGVRRFQNEDGSLTPAGKKRYTNEEILEARNKDRVLAKKLDDVRNEELNLQNQMYDDYVAGKKVYDKRYDYVKPTKKYTDKETSLYNARKFLEQEYTANKKIANLNTPNEKTMKLVTNLVQIAGSIALSAFLYKATKGL